MQILTPTGYHAASTLAEGDQVCAFDAESGAPIINHVEGVGPVDYAGWCRWWQAEETVPAFTWYRVNGSFLLFGEQSIWRNGTGICHAKNLIVGDEIYDDADQPITIISIETVTDESLLWYRFDISGDHSYIIDGLTVHNASRFWVGGTGTWDSSTTAHWAASSGGAGGQSVPGSADAVTLDGSSGGGTVTLNYGGTITLQSIVMGAFTGTFDNSVNNNNMTLSAVTGFNGSGVAVRNIKLGSATYTLSANNGNWSFTTTNNLTFSGSSATVTFTGASATRNFNGGGLAYGTVNIGASSGSGFCNISQANTFNSLNISAPNVVTFPNSNTTTISNLFTWTGTSGSEILILSGQNSLGSTATIAATAGSTAQYCAFRDITVTGSTLAATNSFDLGNNSGITIGPPGGGSFGVIGG